MQLRLCCSNLKTSRYYSPYFGAILTSCWSSPLAFRIFLWDMLLLCCRFRCHNDMSCRHHCTLHNGQVWPKSQSHRRILYAKIDGSFWQERFVMKRNYFAMFCLQYIHRSHIFHRNLFHNSSHPRHFQRHSLDLCFL